MNAKQNVTTRHPTPLGPRLGAVAAAWSVFGCAPRRRNQILPSTAPQRRRLLGPASMISSADGIAMAPAAQAATLVYQARDPGNSTVDQDGSDNIPFITRIGNGDTADVVQNQ